MGFQLDINGTLMEERQIKNVEFCTEIPQDSSARASDHGASLKVWGKMLFDLEAAISDPTLELATWSQVSSDDSDCYRTAEVTVLSGGKTVRTFTLTKAFVMEYTETLDDESGVGEFYIHMKQKKDLTDQVVVGDRF